MSPKRAPSLNLNPIPDTVTTITEAQRQKAREWLKEKYETGVLLPFEDLPDENPLELYIDMLGLNGRRLRDTVKAVRGKESRRGLHPAAESSSSSESPHHGTFAQRGAEAF